MYNWDLEGCPLHGVVGCPLFRGCLCIEVNARVVGTFRIARYIVGVHCPLVLGDQEMETAVSYTKCSQVGGLIHIAGRSFSE